MFTNKFKILLLFILSCDPQHGHLKVILFTKKILLNTLIEIPIYLSYEFYLCLIFISNLPQLLHWKQSCVFPLQPHCSCKSHNDVKVLNLWQAPHALPQILHKSHKSPRLYKLWGMRRKEQCRRHGSIFCPILTIAAWFPFSIPAVSIWFPLPQCRPSGGATLMDNHCSSCVRGGANLTYYLSILQSFTMLLLWGTHQLH